MLSSYFGFNENPFGTTPDPRFLYSSATHKEALASLQYAFYCNRGFTALIAPPGMGKTTLLFEFLRRIQDTARTAFLFNSQMESADLLGSLLREVGVIPQDGLGNILNQLNRELVETARSGKRFVVIVDEAQNLSESVLETLRLLTNFETARAKLMQIVLSGQPQLADKLLSPELVQLRQRISTFCKLDPLSQGETADYIAHRLRTSGYTGVVPFTPETMVRIAEVSEGTPRIINTLCFNALSLCCALKRKKADLGILNEVIADLQLCPARNSENASTPNSISSEGSSASIIFSSKEQDPQLDTKSGQVRKRVPAFALLLLLGCVAAFLGTRPYNREQVRSTPPATATAPLGPFVRESTASLPNALNRPVQADTIEITVNEEETLSNIAVKRLGGFDDDLLRQIKKMNPGLTDPNLIHPGEKILLPRHATLSAK